MILAIFDNSRLEDSSKFRITCQAEFMVQDAGGGFQVLKDCSGPTGRTIDAEFLGKLLASRLMGLRGATGPFESRIKFLLPLAQVPEGDTVTKRTGTKPYVVRDRLGIYGGDSYGRKGEVEASHYGAGCRFLVNDRGDCQLMEGDRIVAWELTAEELRLHLDGALPRKGETLDA
jgi:hypothetical protein